MTESAHALTERRPSVLLVESEAMLRLTMTKFLRSSGYHVVACPDAEAARTALTQSSRSPSLIVLGVRVLDRDTAAVARSLREAAPDVPMLGIADVLRHDEAHVLPENLRFLAHPFDMPDVLRAVQSCLRRSGFHTAISDLA